MKYRIPFFILPLLLLLSCRKEIEVKLPVHEQRLVVNSLLTADSLIEAHVSLSLGALDGAPLPDYDLATVIVTEQGGFTDVLVPQGGGKFTSLFRKPSAGKTYSIQVIAGAYPTASATDAIPAAIPLTDARVSDSSVVNVNGETESEITVKFNDPAGIANHYKLILLGEEMYINGIDTEYYLTPIYYSSLDPSLDQFNVDGTVFNDELIEGRNVEMKLTIPQSSFMQYRSCKAILQSLSKPYYDYSLSYYRHIWSGGSPFSEPVIVTTNITNGYGIFAGFSAAEKSIW